MLPPHCHRASLDTQRAPDLKARQQIVNQQVVVLASPVRVEYLNVQQVALHGSEGFTLQFDISVGG